MGRGAAPLADRSSGKAPAHLLFFVILVFLTQIMANICPSYCTCNMTMQLFYHVDCKGASLDNIPQNLPSKTNTTLLDVKDNRIEILRANSLTNFDQLQLLDMEHNNLKTIDERAFHQCPQLTLLRLAHNSLTKLDPDTFMENSALQYIDLSYNKIFLPTKGPFLKSKSLLILNLTETRLSEIPLSAFSRLNSLSQLELSNNLLKTVNVKALKALMNVNVTVLVSGNPLRCDCALKSTWEWMNAHARPAEARPGALATAAAVDRSEALCDQPLHMRGLSLVELQTLDCKEKIGAGLVTYALCGLAALLVLSAIAAAAFVWGVRKRRRRRGGERKNAGAEGGPRAGRRLQHAARLAPPVGEYIEVLPDNPNAYSAKDVLYESIRESHKETICDDALLRAGAPAALDPQRYVSGYIPPVHVPDAGGPIYVNMKGPPLPLRKVSDVALPHNGPVPASALPIPANGLKRPCSIPLLQGCDFYEVVD